MVVVWNLRKLLCRILKTFPKWSQQLYWCCHFRSWSCTGNLLLATSVVTHFVWIRNLLGLKSFDLIALQPAKYFVKFCQFIQAKDNCTAIGPTFGLDSWRLEKQSNDYTKQVFPLEIKCLPNYIASDEFPVWPLSKTAAPLHLMSRIRRKWCQAVPQQFLEILDYRWRGFLNKPSIYGIATTNGRGMGFSVLFMKCLILVGAANQEWVQYIYNGRLQ